MLNAIKQSFLMLNVIMLNVIMLNVFMLIVIMLNVIILNVVAPSHSLSLDKVDCGLCVTSDDKPRVSPIKLFTVVMNLDHCKLLHLSLIVTFILV